MRECSYGGVNDTAISVRLSPQRARDEGPVVRVSFPTPVGEKYAGPFLKAVREGGWHGHFAEART
jgi:hypothetical protein